MSMDNDRSDGIDEGRALVAEYALGLLSAEEHTRVGRQIAADPRLRKELRLWRTRLAAMDREFTEAPAPAGVLGRVEHRLFGGAAARGGWWNSLALWRSAAAACLAIAIVAVGYNVAQPRLNPQEFATQLVAALQAQEGSGVEFVALYDTATGSVRLTSLSGEVAPDKDLELWYIKGDEPAVSMGVIPVNQKTEIELGPEARAKFSAGDILAISLEQKGGSPTGVHQGPIVALGKATLI
jgi:anti-sigma-K factor RskA